MRISGNEPSSVILSQTKLFQKLKWLSESAQTKLKPRIHALYSIIISYLQPAQNKEFSMYKI